MKISMRNRWPISILLLECGEGLRTRISQIEL